MKTKKNILVTYKLMPVAYFSLAISIKMVSKISVGQKVLHLLSISYLLDFDLQHASLLIMCPEIYDKHIKIVTAYCNQSNLRIIGRSPSAPVYRARSRSCLAI